MMGRLLGLTLTAILFAQAGSTRSIRKRALDISQGSIVKIKLNRKQEATTLIGRVRTATADGIQIELGREDTGQTVQVAFADIKSFKVLSNADDPATDDDPAKSTLWSGVAHGLESLSALTLGGLLWIIGD
jgi:hypothetical protein